MVRTPNLDRLAGEGVRFAQAATVSPVCMPARASFITGLYPHNHNMWTNRGELPAGDETLFHYLQRAGYFTAYIGKSHYYEHKAGLHLSRREDYMRALGLEYVHETTGPRAARATDSYLTDEWREKGLLDLFRQDYAERRSGKIVVRPSPLPVEDFMDGYIGRRAVEFVQNYQDPRPVCLFVGFAGPHDPWDAPGKYATMYDPDQTPPPIPISPRRSALPDAIRDKPDFGIEEGLTADAIRLIRANYYGKISFIDQWCGEILNAFANRGWLDDLFVIFWSDHGEMAGDHGRLHKSTFYESSVRVPLVLRWPERIAAGGVSDALVEIIDVMPTILEAAGAGPSARCLGRTLWPVLVDPACEHRANTISEILYHGVRNVMIRDRRYKYAVDQRGLGFMLYDLAGDPDEQDNLIGRPEANGLEHDMREALLLRFLEAQWSMGNAALQGGSARGPR